MRAFHTLALITLLATPGAAQPAPQGQRIVARDGDTVVVENGARVRIVRRIDATIRAIYNDAQHWLVLLADYDGPNGGPADGVIDERFVMQGVTGNWPLGERWDGHGVIEASQPAALLIANMITLTTNGAVVQMFSPVEDRSMRDPAATAVLTFGGRSNGPEHATMDVAEQRAVDMANRMVQTRSPLQSGTLPPGTGRIGGEVIGLPNSPSPQPAQAPIRVGGSIRKPEKIQDAAPEYPPQARQAGIGGIVILEIVVGTEGSVTDAKVLKSIPSLDAAAVAAVKRWRYEITRLNGVPVPIILTVTVNFQ